MRPVDRLARYIIIAIWLALTLNCAALYYEVFSGNLIGRDATDAADRRSGLALRTDYGTGCQYLVTMFGGITPRLDQTGHHICEDGR